MRVSLPVVCILVLGLASIGGAKKKPEASVRFFAEVAAENGAPFSTEIQKLDGSGKMFISKVAIVTEKDITSFTPFQNADGTIGAYFFLDGHGKLAWETMSIEQRGKTIVALVNGRRVIDLLIDRRVSDGIAAIPAGILPEELDLLRKGMKLREAGTPVKE